MKLTRHAKKNIKQALLQSLIPEPEIQKIIIFGSFLVSDDPQDIDVAVFQNSEEPYLALAMKYRRLIRNITRKIPVDVIPVKNNSVNSSFLSEIEAGEIIYER